MTLLPSDGLARGRTEVWPHLGVHSRARKSELIEIRREKLAPAANQSPLVGELLSLLLDAPINPRRDERGDTARDKPGNCWNDDLEQVVHGRSVRTPNYLIAVCNQKRFWRDSERETATKRQQQSLHVA